MHAPLYAKASAIHMLVLSLVTLQTGNVAGGTTTQAVLSGTMVRVEADLAEGRLRERYLAKTDDDTWVEVATSEGVSGGPVCLYGVQSSSPGNVPQEIPVTATQVSASPNEMTETFSSGPHRIVRRISLDNSGPWLHVTTRLEPSQTAELQSFADGFAFSQRAEWSYSPSVGGFNPDAQYKAPLILVQSKRLAFGIVPDVRVLTRDTLGLCHHALDLDVTASPSLRVGFLPTRLARHSVYRMDPQRAWKLEKPLENTYFLLVTATAEAGQAYRQCVRFHWERFGRPSQSAAAEQQKGTGPYQDLVSLDQWRRRVWDEESRKAWLQIVLPDGSIGGGVSTSRALGPRSIYLSSWFNSLRTAFGMALYARRIGNDDLLQLTSQTVELALKSFGANGAFKCIAALDKNNELVWGAGDGSGGSTIQGYLGYDMSWTAYWLLRWREARLPGHERVLPRCQGLARFLIARQQPDGMFATFFDEAGNPLKDKEPYTIAETGPVALFLLKLYEADRQPEYLEAAKNGLAFLEKEVVPQRKWYDFETFWSCSPRGIDFDTRTGQWPANNLALGQTVAAFLQAWRVMGDRAYLEKGESLLDYLLLYQQCWTNPLLDGLTGPAMLLGGFTTQNSDAEWSDARQSQCGNILLDYYRATGKAEYLERGVAALRAQFPISPSENWAHGGYGGKAGVSSFHWGSGSGMAGIEIDEELEKGIAVPLKNGDRTFGEGIGLCVKFSQGQPRKDLALLKDLGVRWVRENEAWARVERAAGKYEFSPAFKERLAFYRENHIAVVFILAYDNKVAYPPTPDDPDRNIDPEAFSRYAAAAARLLRESGVHFVLEVWNEPHNFVLRKQLGGPWHGGPPCPWLDHYIKMVREAVRRVKAFDPTIELLSDEDCTIIHYRLLEAGLPRELDGMAFHPYLSRTVTKPEMTKEGRGAAWESPFTLADEDHSFRSMVRRLREQGAAKLGKTPELWITEFGCPVQENVSSNVTFELGSTSEEGLAALLVRAFIGAEAAGVKVMTWFSFWDGPDGPMGLLAKDGHKRKSYHAFATMRRQLGEYVLVRQVAGGGHLTSGVQAYLFHKGGDWKLVTWTVDGPTRKLTLTGALREAQAQDVLSEAVEVANDSAGVRQLELTTSPLYLSGVRGDEPVEPCFQGLEFLSTGEASSTYSTTFDGAEDPLSEGGKWINNGLDWTRIRKQGGIAHGTQTGRNQGIYRYDDSYAHLSGFPPDQEAWAQVHIAKPDPSCHQELEILLRWTSSAHRTTGYECFARCVNDGSSYLQVVRWEGPLGKFTYLADKRGTNYGLKDGDILKASIVGHVITVSINGVEKARVEDDTHKTGDPGIGTFLSCDSGRGVGSNADFGFRSFTARGIGGDHQQRRN